MQLNLPGRTSPNDLLALFTKSELFRTQRLDHTPFLVFLVGNRTLDVVIVEAAVDLLDYPNETPVMAQWPGTWHSDWFHFTIGQYRDHLARLAEAGRAPEN